MSYGFSFEALFHTRLTASVEESRTVLLKAFPYDVSVILEPWSVLHKQWARFCAEGFSDELSARAAGEQCLAQVSIGAALGRVGVVFPKETLSVIGPVASEERTFRGAVEASLTIEQLDDKFMTGCEFVNAPTEAQLICAGLICDSLILNNTDAQFITRITAIEALCDQGRVSASDRDALQRLVALIPTVGLSEEVATTVRNSLGNTKQISVRAAYRAKIGSLLGEEATKTFQSLYKLRSELVHDGLGRGGLGKAAASALKLAIELLDKDLRSQGDTALPT